MSLKTSTCILFKPNKTFDSFGYDAEDAYGELSAEENGEHKKWYYFRRFKMELFNNVVCIFVLKFHRQHEPIKRKPSGFPISSDTNQAVQPQKCTATGDG